VVTEDSSGKEWRQSAPGALCLKGLTAKQLTLQALIIKRRGKGGMILRRRWPSRQGRRAICDGVEIFNNYG
jgi:hypothetical protein